MPRFGLKPAVLFYFALGLVLLPAAQPALAASRTSASRFLDKPEQWYRGPEARAMAEDVLSYEAVGGGWPKNVDTATAPYKGNAADLAPTFDNDATTDELRFLARMVVATNEPRYQQAFVKGLDYILKAQYPNGGWPQSYPPSGSYHRYITFNDGAMARLMVFIKEVVDERTYGFVDQAHRRQCSDAFERGVQCILKCQIKVDGKLTGWCAQHDEKDLSPRQGRLYEMPSISGSESVGVVRVLMSIERPSTEIIAAVEGACAWFASVKVPGIRIEERPQPGLKPPYDRYVIEDPAAPPMWARFYEIGTNRPIFCDRDSVVKYKYSEISHERRTGYVWLRYWPKELLEKDYPAWREKWVVKPADGSQP